MAKKSKQTANSTTYIAFAHIFVQFQMFFLYLVQFLVFSHFQDFTRFPRDVHERVHPRTDTSGHIHEAIFHKVCSSFSCFGGNARKRNAIKSSHTNFFFHMRQLELKTNSFLIKLIDRLTGFLQILTRWWEIFLSFYNWLTASMKSVMRSRLWNCYSLVRQHTRNVSIQECSISLFQNETTYCLRLLDILHQITVKTLAREWSEWYS